MPSGILFNPNDGGPAMEITAGLRAPSFAMSVPDVFDTNVYTVPNYISGSQVVVMPKTTVFSMYRGTNLVPTVGMLDSVSISGSTVTFNTWWSDNWGRPRTFASNIFQIIAAGSGSRGLYVQDSTDFTAITDATMCGFCVWRGTVTFTGSWTTPATTIDRSRYIVFAKWDAPGVVVEFDGNAITAVDERDSDGVNATVTMQIAIFASGVAPTPAAGITIINSAGQCTFSLAKRPFVYRSGTVSLSWSAQNIGDNLIMLGRFGYDSRVTGGWDFLKWAGIVRTANTVRAGRGKTYTTWTSDYSVTGQRLTQVPIPLIPNMY